MIKLHINSIPKEVIEIITTLNNNGYMAYLVGGCIRDSIIHKQVKDWDITTNALPEQIINSFSNYEQIQIGKDHGTIGIIINHTSFEITTFRIDKDYTDNRHPNEVEFTNDIIKDLARRDFTINAIAYDITNGELIDPFNGYSDIQNKLIKCVGNPIDRFTEDALRILRCFRFAFKYQFQIEKYTEQVAYNLFDRLSYISIERIQSEFNQILMNNYDNSNMIYKFMIYFSQLFIPELFNCIGIEQNNDWHIYDVFEHIMETTNIATEYIDVKLACLLHDIGKVPCKTTDEKNIDHFYGHAEKSVEMATDILKRLKYSNEISNNVLTLIKYHDYLNDTEFNKKHVRKLLNKVGKDLIYKLYQVKVADAEAQSELAEEKIKYIFQGIHNTKEILEAKEPFNLKDLAIDGHDVMELKFVGKDIGIILNKCLALVLQFPDLNNKDDLIYYCSEYKANRIDKGII